MVGSEENVVGRLDELADALPLEGAGMRDLFEVRETLEAKAAGWAARRRSDHHLERLADIIDDARGHVDELWVLGERDAQFHVALAEASQNLVLVRVMLTLLGLTGAARGGSLAIPGRAWLSLDQHENILRAVRAADPHEARRAMLEHLASVEGAIPAPDLREYPG